MKTSPIGHSTWNLLSQCLKCYGIWLFFLTQVIGDPCQYNSKTVTKKVSGEETTYLDSVGHPLELFCTVRDIGTKTKLTSKNLVFQKDDHLVDKKFVRQVNDTTISLKLDNKKSSTRKYYCYLNIPKETNEVSHSSSNRTVSKKFNYNDDSKALSDSSDRETVCWNLVVIGSDAKKVKNISCTIDNWQELNCTWQVPMNDVQTNYTIKYEPVGSGIAFACPNDDDVHNSTCKWTNSTKPAFQKDSKKLKVTVTGVNILNKTTETSVEFNEFSIVRVKGPEKLKFVDKTPSSIKLEWSIGAEMQNFRWAYKILYKTIISDWTSIIFDSKNTSRSGRRISYTVGNLTSNTMYDFQVYMKPYTANDNYWSKGHAGNVFRTKKL